MAKSIEEIAKMAGVSKTTVSMVINGKGADYRISEKTQEKIRAIVEQEEFRPNQYARAFRLQKTKMIGLVVPELTNWFFSQLSQEIEIVSRSQGYQLLITCSDDNEDTENKVIRNLLERKVEGLIIASVMKKEKITDQILKLDIPVVFIDRRIESEQVSWIASDNFQGTYDLVSSMCSKGAKNIFYLGGTKTISTSKNRLKGYRHALEDNGLVFNSDIVLQKEYSDSAGYDLTRHMIEIHGGLPEAYITSAFTLLQGSLKYLKEAFGEIPEELMIGTFDDHPLLDFLNIKISSVRQDTRSMAFSAFEMILNALCGESCIKHQIIKPELLLR